MTKEDFLKELGVAIANARKKQNLSQNAVAKLLFIERGNLTRIEKGKTNVTADTLLKISEAIKVPVSDFFSFQTFETKPTKEK